jgi:uroporphyrinogen-III decarboxylase
MTALFDSQVPVFKSSLHLYCFAGNLVLQTPDLYMADPWLKKEESIAQRGRRFHVQEAVRIYWPSLKKVMDALIEEGISLRMVAEGRYNERLEYIKDFPKGWVTWQFDQTDMANAKKIVGDTCCISGNVPASVLITGTAKEVKECCRILIETCAPGGGYILAGGAAATEVSAENLRAFMEASKEYGIYR